MISVTPYWNDALVCVAPRDPYCVIYIVDSWLSRPQVPVYYGCRGILRLEFPEFEISPTQLECVHEFLHRRLQEQIRTIICGSPLGGRAIGLTQYISLSTMDLEQTNTDLYLVGRPQHPFFKHLLELTPLEDR